jgi:short-subunit dehydrogenase
MTNRTTATLHTLVTGASAGLGEIFAERLAAQDRNLVLVARRGDRLAALAAGLENRHDVTAHPIAMDLAAPGAPAQLFEQLARDGIEIDMLINNAGFGARGSFATIDRSRQAEMIDLNCRALVELSHLALPAMQARGAGAILNVASIAGLMPGPYMAVYYATKAFVVSFSHALHEELKGSGIIVTALCPGPTKTEFSEVAGLASAPAFNRVSGTAEQVVDEGLAALARGRAMKVSGPWTGIMALGALFPRAFSRKAVGCMQRARG